MKYEEFIKQAEIEGFVVSYRTDKDTYELQKLDDVDIFPTDYYVWDYVVGKAMNGSSLHCAVLKFIQENNPKEYEEILDRCCTW
jgi:hypothetical protein